MNYDEMTLQELKAAAKEMGIKGVTAMKKKELAELLKSAKGMQKADKQKDNKQRESRHKDTQKTAQTGKRQKNSY